MMTARRSKTSAVWEAMAEQQLDGAQIGAGFQQMDGEGVAKRMRRDRFSALARASRHRV